jgi:flotillin
MRQIYPWQPVMKNVSALHPAIQVTLPRHLALPHPPPLQVGQIAANLPLVILPLAAAVVGISLVKICLRICDPNEILVLSGRKHRNAAGQELGYRVIVGGRAVVIPILETVQKLSLATMPAVVEVKNAYSKGGIPLNIQAIANVKVSSHPEIVGNAIERFLGRDRSEIERVSRETLEGNLRGVVATLTPEEINEDRLQFAERIMQDVSRDLAKLGLQLDTFKIQSVADEVDYLRSIGRQRIAQVIRDAEIAEAEAVGQAERIEAECQQQAEVAKTQALAIVQQKQNEQRKIKAELDQQAHSEEERTTAAAAEARARAEQQLQTVRAELETLRLEAERVLPAEAARQASVWQARGAAAKLVENAKASAQVNDLLAQVLRDAGPGATDIFFIQQLETVLKQAAAIPNRLHLQRVQVIDNGSGESLAGLVNAYPDMVRQFLGRVDQTLGLNMVGILSQAGTGGNLAPLPTPATPPPAIPQLPAPSAAPPVPPTTPNVPNASDVTPTPSEGDTP